MDKKIPAPSAKVVPKSVAKKMATGLEVVNPAAFLSDIVRLYSDIQKQQTELAKIKVTKTVKLKEIAAKRKVFLSYLDKAFAERAENFRRLFTSVDAALANGNNEQLGLVLHSITELAKTTPFKDLIDIDKTRGLLTDPDHEWRL
jgi:hypothetical protein